MPKREYRPRAMSIQSTKGEEDDEEIGCGSIPLSMQRQYLYHTELFYYDRY
jgi:hypothetical protein